MLKTNAGDIIGGKAERILRIHAVTEVTGLPTSSIFALMAAGHFPKSVKLSTRAAGWLESEVQAWIATRIAERDASEMEAA